MKGGTWINGTLTWQRPSRVERFSTWPETTTTAVVGPEVGEVEKWQTNSTREVSGSRILGCT